MTMWSSRKNKKNNVNNNGSSSGSPSKSSSSCSSPSSIGTPNKKSMEEVWQDISLTSLQDHTIYSTSTAAPNTTSIPSSSAGLIFQDFFSRPFNKDPPPPPPTTTKSATVPQSTEPSNNCCFGRLAPHHGTLLSLNSGSGFHYLENITAYDHQRAPSQQLQHGFPLNNSPSDNAAALGPAQVVPSICLKRPQANGDYSNDQRHKRLMKNRESAARSRARKQAYTTELEQEVAQLEKENAKLRRQLEQVNDKLLAASGLPKKQKLYRTSTAPF